MLSKHIIQILKELSRISFIGLPIIFLFISNAYFELKPAVSLLDAFVFSLFIIIAYLFFYCLLRSCTISAEKALAVVLVSIIVILYATSFFDFLNRFIPKTIFGFKYQLVFLLALLLAVFGAIRKGLVGTKHQVTFIQRLFLLLISAQIIIGVFDWSNKDLPISSAGGEAFRKPLPFKNNFYLIVADEYASSEVLLKRFGYNNSLDSGLAKLGFTAIQRSFSNYNATRFSIASLLNGSILPLNLQGKKPTLAQYSNVEQILLKSSVVKQFEKNGYEIKNLSIFDFENHPSERKGVVFDKGLNLIIQRTLLARMNRLIYPELQKINWLSNILGSENKQIIKDNENIYALLLQESSNAGTKKFIYGHLLMPHQPFYKDSVGTSIPPEIYEQDGYLDNEQAYLSFLKYTNKKLEYLFTAIVKNDPNAHILFLSDHGYRNSKWKSSNKEHFRNYLSTRNLPNLVQHGTDTIYLAEIFQNLLGIPNTRVNTDTTIETIGDQ